MGAQVAIGAWGTLLASCVAGGAALCASLVVTRRWVWLCAVCGAGAGLGIGASMTAIWHATDRADTLVASGFLGVAALLGGFALLAAILSSLSVRGAGRRPLDRVAHDGLTHVILLADAEPDEYSPRAIIRAFADFDATDVPVPPDAARILVYASERARYRQVGHSPARPTVRALAVAVSMLLDTSRFAVPVMPAFCTGEQSLADEIEGAAQRGAGRIVVARLGVARSRAFDMAEREAAELQSERAGVRIAYTHGLWSADELIGLVSQRVVDSFEGGPDAEDGVVLASEGQPWQWDTAYPDSGEHSTFFSQRVRAELVSRGMREERIRQAWIDWEEPNVTEVVRHLVALGSKRIAVVPATMPFDTVSTLLDVGSAAEQAAADPGVAIGVLPAWADDPAVARAIATRVEEAASEFGEATARG